ncbi:conserved hypothetical protein [Vibrio parahaemolyticus AQ3810]|nr:conserved hypothetical protein [Vibrio parahaemolyticus AQ3810]
MLAATEILNELGAGEIAYQVCVIIVSALVGLLVCLSEQYRFKAEEISCIGLNSYQQRLQKNISIGYRI